MSHQPRKVPAGGRIAAVARIDMKTINLPKGNAFGVDDDESGHLYVNPAEHHAKTLFFVWATLTEHKWVILGERRGDGCSEPWFGGSGR